MACNISNIAQCVIDKLLELLQSFVNAPIKPLLTLVQKLLSQPPNIEAFGSIWAVMVYVISLFYGLFLVFAGLNFIISGTTPEKRERAKEWLQNVLLMILFVQSSYILYALVTQLAGLLTTGALSMIHPDFFLITFDNPQNVYLEITIGIAYLAILFITVIVLAINYFIASIGIILAPFGIFFYFIPPLRDIGRFIINKLLFILFIPFFSSVILVAVSQFSTIPGMDSGKIIFMIAAFASIDVLLIIITLLALAKAVMSVLSTDIAKTIMFVKGHFLAGAAKEKQMTSREFYSKPRTDAEVRAYRRGRR